jgi:hypothetical protein
MKNILFFITHKTLTIEHAELTLGSFSRQKCDSMFDVLYIYNSHEEELPNEFLINLCQEYNLKKFFKEIVIFPYEPNTLKTLGSDVLNIRVFCKNNYDLNDRVLIIKSDTILSVNYFDDILNKISKKDLIYFVAPFICAKKRVPNEEIVEYSQRDTYIKSDEITFFVEDQYQSSDNDFFNRPGVDVEDSSILFTSCYVIRDFSCHFLSIGLLDLIGINEQSWGGVSFAGLVTYFIATERSFVIHKYHNIKSENRITDREGPVERWITS